MSSARDAVRAITGVDQPACTARFVRHTSRPFRRSSATMNDRSPLSSSHCRMIRFSNNTGDEPVPMPNAGMPPSVFFHASLPAKS